MENEYDVYIGSLPSANPFEGILDELRISNAIRNASWITTSYNTMNDSANFTTFCKQEAQNVAPELSSPSPADGATGQNTNPQLSITVNDTNANAMDVYFLTNATGSWTTIDSNLSVYNGTYSQTPSNMYSWGTKYYWSANVTDGKLWTNHTYSFTTIVYNYVIYHFDAYNVSQAWANDPEYMVNNNTANMANCEVGTHVQHLTSNTCPGTNLGTIEKVEIRCYGDDSDDVGATYLRPIFNGTTDGNNYDADLWIETWSNYSNITDDPNAPSTWTWSDVQNLEMDVEGNTIGGSGNDYVGAVQVRVNYSTSPYLYTFTKGLFRKLTDFIPGATSIDKKYTQFIDITEIADVTNGKLFLKITEELDEITYLDRIYLRIDEHKELEINIIEKLDTTRSQLIKQLLKDSDNKYLEMKTGDEYILEFNIPESYQKIEFAAEGYYVQYY
jgi:hypothetical protein